MGKDTKRERELTDSEIHFAITGVFLYWNVGYDRKPIPLTNLTEFVSQELAVSSWAHLLRIRLLVLKSERYVVLRDGVIANR
jgi:hypothetical protein